MHTGKAAPIHRSRQTCVKRFSGFRPTAAHEADFSSRRYVLLIRELGVEDTGIGMDPDRAEALFEPFRQESEGMGREYEGTGLGLAVTKQMVEEMEAPSRWRARRAREVGSPSGSQGPRMERPEMELSGVEHPEKGHPGRSGGPNTLDP